MKPPDRKDILLHLEDLGESSDDSDFRIEDHCLDGSDSSDGSVDSNSSDGTKYNCTFESADFPSSWSRSRYKFYFV